ncbi:MAG: leucine-rich repeat protein [Lachnospira sp.]
MGKKVLAVILGICIIVSMFPALQNVQAADVLTGSCGNNATYEFNLTTGELTISGSGDMSTYSSSSLAPWGSYTYRAKVKKITINEGITGIGNYAFYNCFNATSVSIPNTVTSIGVNAFQSCANLQSVNLPGSVKSISTMAFMDCTGLTGFTMTDNVKSIGEAAFQNCTSLGSITLSKNLTSIDNQVFFGCKSLTSIAIPDSVTSIGESAFNGCSSLSAVNMGSGVSSIGKYAFSNCSKLTSIDISYGVKSILAKTFEYCSSLKSVYIPGSVTSISSTAFYICSSLSEIRGTKGSYAETYASSNGLSFKESASNNSGNSGGSGSGSGDTGNSGNTGGSGSGDTGNSGSGTGGSGSGNTGNSGSGTGGSGSGNTGNSGSGTGGSGSGNTGNSGSGTGGSGSGDTGNSGSGTGGSGSGNTGNSGSGTGGSGSGSTGSSGSGSSGLAQSGTEAQVIKEAPAAPDETWVKPAKNGICVSWSQVPWAKGYYVYRKDGDNSWERITTIENDSTFSYVDSDVSGQKEYRYAVEAFNDFGASEYGPESGEIMFVPGTTIKGVKNTPDGIQIKWENTPGATGYIVYRSINGGNSTRVATVKNAAYLDRSAHSSGVIYTYKIVAYYKAPSGVCYKSAGSSIRTKAYISKTPESETEGELSGIKLTWSPAINAEAYIVYRSIDGGLYKKVTATTYNSLMDKTAVLKGSRYSYKVMACYTTSSGNNYQVEVSNLNKTYLSKKR